jgi:hypothetical protein
MPQKGNDVAKKVFKVSPLSPIRFDDQKTFFFCKNKQNNYSLNLI